MRLKDFFPISSECDPVKPLHRPPASQQIYKSTIPSRYHGFALEQYFASRFTYQTREAWTAKILSGDILLNGKRPSQGVFFMKGTALSLMRGCVRNLLLTAGCRLFIRTDISGCSTSLRLFRYIRVGGILKTA